MPVKRGISSASVADNRKRRRNAGNFPNSGTCSKQTNFVLNDDHTIESIEVIGGCNGNLKGICRLLKGMKAEDVIARLEVTVCGFLNTSCPDQIAKNLKKALAEMN